MGRFRLNLAMYCLVVVIVSTTFLSFIANYNNSSKSVVSPSLASGSVYSRDALLYEINAKLDIALGYIDTKVKNISGLKKTDWASGGGTYGSCSRGKGTGRIMLHKRNEYVYFTDKFVLNEEPVVTWLSEASTKRFCNDKINVFGDQFSVLHGVTLHPTRLRYYASQSKGGEKVYEVMNQQLSKEKFRFKSGYWEVDCSQDSYRVVAWSSYKLLRYLKINPVSSDHKADLSGVEVVDKYTIAIQRGDYANLHNWARNVYNTFLIMMHLNVRPDNVSVLFLDSHPYTNLDISWKTVYGDIVRAGQLEKPVYYKNLVWGFEESYGPVSVSVYREPHCPYLEEYRAFVLSQHNLTSVVKLDCKELTISLLIRRDAIYHPRNMAGTASRKIFNEAEVIADLIAAFPDACVQAVLLDSMPMKQQLEIMSNTDILIGVHGAGMTHTLFLPRHAAVLELFTKGFKNGRPWHICYEAICTWRGLKYDSWENFDSALEMNEEYTILPSKVVVERTKALYTKLCHV